MDLRESWSVLPPPPWCQKQYSKNS
jgi:hypothetical protein